MEVVQLKHSSLSFLILPSNSEIHQIQMLKITFLQRLYTRKRSMSRYIKLLQNRGIQPSDLLKVIVPDEHYVNDLQVSKADTVNC